VVAYGLLVKKKVSGFLVTLVFSCVEIISSDIFIHASVINPASLEAIY